MHSRTEEFPFKYGLILLGILQRIRSFMAWKFGYVLAKGNHQVEDRKYLCKLR